MEQDKDDKYDLARQLLQPLIPWFREVRFNGPIQVTAIKRNHYWMPIEYNVRTGVTSGPMILRMLENPLQVLQATSQNRRVEAVFKKDHHFGCCLTLAGWGYPYIAIEGPRLPVTVQGSIQCDLFWNEVAEDRQSGLYMTGHRIADVVAISDTLDKAIAKAYENIKKIRCLSSYYRTDIGESLWPPGSE